uniref:Putative secreted protein n=1 Tax=Rhipicephalus microplus TaxID=6941 RepID=A0A6M2DAW9_RHIMP
MCARMCQWNNSFVLTAVCVYFAVSETLVSPNGVIAQTNCCVKALLPFFADVCALARLRNGLYLLRAVKEYYKC